MNAEDVIPISIPIEMEIKITILDIDEEDLYQDTKSFLNSLDLSMLKDMKEGQTSAKDSGEVMNTTTSLSRKLRKGYERDMDLILSEKVYGGEGMYVFVCVSCD